MDVKPSCGLKKEYIASNGKDLNRLVKYAELFKIGSLVRMYTKVLL